MNKWLKRSSWFLLGILLLGWGCGTSKKTTSTDLKDRKPDYLLDRLIEQQRDAEWFSAKAKFLYEDESLTFSANATIKMRKDSIFWMNVKKLGIEFARVMITPDSVYLINRWDKEYLIKDLSYVSQTLNIPANFSSLQTFVLGNPFFFTTKGLQAENSDLSYHLYGTEGGMENHYWLSGADYHLEQMGFIDKSQDRMVQIDFQKYQDLSNKKNFSYFRKLKLNSPGEDPINLEIDFSKVDLETPQVFRFKIPERYSRVD